MPIIANSNEITQLVNSLDADSSSVKMDIPIH